MSAPGESRRCVPRISSFRWSDKRHLGSSHRGRRAGKRKVRLARKRISMTVNHFTLDFCGGVQGDVVRKPLNLREDGGQRSCASWHLHSRAYWQCVSWIRLRPRPSVQRRLKQQARTNRLFLLRPIVAVPGIVIAAAARKFRSRNITTKRACALKAIASCAPGGHRCDRRGTCAPMPCATPPRRDHFIGDEPVRDNLAQFKL